VSDALRRLKDRASAAYADQRLREALSLFTEIAERDPSDLSSRMKLGDIHRRQGQREQAVRTYASVARKYAEEGFLLKAIAACKVLLSVEPRHTETQAMLAELYAKRQRPAAPAPAAGSAAAIRGGVPRIPGAGAAPVAPAQFGGPPAPRGMNIPQAQTWAGQIDVRQLSAEGAGAVPPRAGPSARPPPPPAPDPAAPGAAGHQLPEIPLFSDLPRPAFIELLVHIKMRDVLANQPIIKEGDTGDSFFVVASGRVRVTRRNDVGQQVLLARLTDGAFFGEMASLQPGPRTATVTAEVPSQVLELSRDVLNRVAHNYPGVGQVLDNFRRQRLLATAMATHELFRPFSPPERRQLMEKFKGRAFAKGTVLLSEGQPPSGLYIVLYGSLRVTMKMDQEIVDLAELKAGDMFGEMSLLTNDPTNATITATSDCFVIRLSRAKFQDVMMTHPHVLEVVARISEERQQKNERLIGLEIAPHAAMLV
jgi:CRP-like cAMP-binding protein